MSALTEVAKAWPTAERAFLTPAEREAIDLTARLADLLGVIIRFGPEASRSPERSTVEHDLNELVAPLHVIQRALMAQAAARAYPTMLRPLGGLVRAAS